MCMYVYSHALYRHSEDMIKKLENAGLGFYVRETETHQKLGIFSVYMCKHNIVHVQIYVTANNIRLKVKSLSASWCIVCWTSLPV